jgi:hypothetical protein
MSANNDEGGGIPCIGDTSLSFGASVSVGGDGSYEASLSFGGD